MFMLAQRRRPAQAEDCSRRFWLDASAETALHPQINDHLPLGNGYAGRSWVANGYDHPSPALMDCYNQATPTLAWVGEDGRWHHGDR
ncbi:MAG: hypothetical protein NZ528_13780 [Caldilineales bacterium]|nr:hypothetical protein [Caldilineales bacterium]MDW8317860.1 hypothetical protein [Anaerolineae bacterium]